MIIPEPGALITSPGTSGCVPFLGLFVGVRHGHTFKDATTSWPDGHLISGGGGREFWCVLVNGAVHYVNPSLIVRFNCTVVMNDGRVVTYGRGKRVTTFHT